MRLDTNTTVWQDVFMTNTTTNNLTTYEQEELDTLEAAFSFLGGRGVEIAERIDELRAKRDTRPVIDPDAAQKALALVVKHGAYLASKDEWDPEDNYDATEELYDLYQRITGMIVSGQR